jgi:DNA repair exonuclease SbcCD nuclease subunit
MKIAHLADTHIKNLKYHYEYRRVFEQLYEQLRAEEVDYIVHCGDIAHTKTQISPEFVELCSEFFRGLSTIAPTYIILGNHDGNLKNSSRQDALTPIVDALDLQNLHLLKKSGEVMVNETLTLNVLSVFDEAGWVQPSDDSKINIALYHGAINGVSTDIGWVMDHGDHDVSIFEGHDYVLLGDIHKTNQVLDVEGRVRYAGSTVQQNHGETNDKGYLIWEIHSKDDFTVKHHILKNPKPFITIELTPKGRMPRGTAVPTGARLRLVSKNNLPLSKMKKAVDIAKHRFKPESITFLNRAAGDRGSVEDMANNLKTEDLRDPAIQKQLICEYLKDYEVDNTLMERVLDLNNRYGKVVEQSEEVGRNINWKLHKVEWDNLFNYGEGNSIDFEKTNGIIGIFGKNYSGKSSVIDSVLYTMFNTTSKNERKNLNIINQNRSSCRGALKISVGENLYSIERTSEKYTKRIKGEETTEAKTDLNFEVYNQATGETESLNGLSRIETDKNIRKHFGTLDDFMISAISSQHGALSFIDEGSTRRKEIIAKFLDLEMFEKKFKLAKDDAADTRGALRRLDDREYDTEIQEARLELKTNEEQVITQKSACAILKKEITTVSNEITALSTKIDSIPAEVIDVVAVREKYKKAKNKKVALSMANQENRENRKKNEEMYEKINNFLETFNLEDLTEKKEI